MLKFYPFEASEQLVKLFCSELRTLTSKNTRLKKFVDEIETVDFSNRREFKRIVPPIILKQTLHHMNQIGSNANNILHFSLKISFYLNWARIYDGLNKNLSYVNGMFASRILGLDGYFIHNRLSIGQMLLLPGVTYPFHTHDVAEIYYCLSGSLNIYHGLTGGMTQLTSGNLSITPEGQLHKLKVNGSEPVLLLYSWVGDLQAPIWIWNKTREEDWERTLWKRNPGQSWIVDIKESLSKEMVLAVQKPRLN
jgi:mannose-6-phosphate isomerase-like protein (cupin superfamily)